MSLFQKAPDEARNSTEPRASKSWENPATRVSGNVTAMEPFQKEDLSCRKLQSETRTPDTRGKSEFNYCRMKDGQWKVLD